MGKILSTDPGAEGDPLESLLADPEPGEFGARPRTKVEHARLASYWFANNFHWGALLLILLPGDLAKLAGRDKAAALGNLTAFGALLALVVPLLAGVLSDRCRARIGRRRPFLLWGTVVNIGGLAVMASAVGARSIPLYTLGYLVVQLGNNLALGAYMGVMPDLVIPEERGVASGFMALQSQVGTLFGAFGAGLLLRHAPDTVKYALVAIVLMVGVGVGWRAIDEKPLTAAPPKLDWLAYVKSLWIDPKLHPDFFWVWITRFLVMLGFYAVLPNVNYYLIDVVGIKADDVGQWAPILLGVILIVSSFSGVYGGVLSDRIGRKKVVYLANALIAVVAPIFIFTHSFIPAVIVGALFGLGYGAYISVDYALGNDVLPDQVHGGKDMAVWHIAMTLPQVLGAYVASRFLTLAGATLDPTQKLDGEPLYHYGLGGYAAIFILCSVSFALGAYLLKNVRGVR